MNLLLLATTCYSMSPVHKYYTNIAQILHKYCKTAQTSNTANTPQLSNTAHTEQHGSN